MPNNRRKKGRKKKRQIQQNIHDRSQLIDSDMQLIGKDKGNTAIDDNQMDVNPPIQLILPFDPQQNIPISPVQMLMNNENKFSTHTPLYLRTPNMYLNAITTHRSVSTNSIQTPTFKSHTKQFVNVCQKSAVQKDFQITTPFLHQTTGRKRPFYKNLSPTSDVKRSTKRARSTPELMQSRNSCENLEELNNYLCIPKRLFNDDLQLKSTPNYANEESNKDDINEIIINISPIRTPKREENKYNVVDTNTNRHLLDNIFYSFSFESVKKSWAFFSRIFSSLLNLTSIIKNKLNIVLKRKSKSDSIEKLLVELNCKISNQSRIIEEQGKQIDEMMNRLNQLEEIHMLQTTSSEPVQKRPITAPAVLTFPVEEVLVPPPPPPPLPPPQFLFTAQTTFIRKQTKNTRNNSLLDNGKKDRPVITLSDILSVKLKKTTRINRDENLPPKSSNTDLKKLTLRRVKSNSSKPNSNSLNRSSMLLDSTNSEKSLLEILEEKENNLFARNHSRTMCQNKM